MPNNHQKIQRIFSVSEVKHGLSLFSKEELDFVENLIKEEEGKLFIKCQIKEKYKFAKPEEIIRQLFIHRLISEYGYPKERIDVERVIYFGSRDSGLADIVVMHENTEDPFIIFEVKRPKRSDGLEQLKSYCNAEGAPIGVWSNGNEIILLHREEPNIFTSIPRIPRATETLRDVLTERWTIKWLEENDELKKGKTTLKKILLDLEELVLGNAGVKVFDEVFKLIYAKLYDEWQGINNPQYQLEFFVGDRRPKQVKEAISNLLVGAKRIWPGVFEPTEKIELIDSHLKICVSFLEKIKLFNSNLQIIDEAFEYLIPQVSKKKEGQFFTPRPVEDMIVKMLNPKPNEFVIDPACGSAGFLLHSVMWVARGVITGKELPETAKNFAQNNIYGIDFAKEAVKIAKAINLIVGDGKSHIFGGSAHGNSLNPLIWDDEIKSGLRPRLLRFPNNPEKDRENGEKFLFFDFDVLMTNPPFAGTVKEREILRLYKLAEKGGRLVNKIGRHILFLERSLQFLRPGGRMAIVLPQGIFNNTNAEYIRRFIMEEARILAVVGLHVNTFKPHTGTKTSVLFLQKYTDEEKERIQQIKAKYESKFDEYFNELKEKYNNCNWDTTIDEEKLPEELKAFLDSYFASAEEIEETENETAEAEENEAENSYKIEEKEESESKEIELNALIEEYKEITDVVIQEKKDQLNNIKTNIDTKNIRIKELKKEIKTLSKEMERNETNNLKAIIDEKKKELEEVKADIKNNKIREREIKKEIRALEGKAKKLCREISERTLGGQIWLVLNDEKIKEEFKKFWIDGNVIKEMDYPIFMAVNKKPVKDNSGDYRYKKNPDGSFVLDEHGHPVIDHDLDEIAEAFIKFAKEQDFYFWRE